MAAKRMRGLAVSRPVLIGSTATPLTPAEKLSAPPDHTHRWTVAVRSVAGAPLPTLPPTAGAASGVPGSSAGSSTPDSGSIGTRLRDSELDLHRAVGGKDDLSYFIKRVQFRLHETYPQPTRNVDRSPFSVTETGWGEFEIQIKIFFVPEAGEKPLTLVHHLKLHPWTSQAAAPPPAGSDTGAGGAAEADPAAQTAPAGDGSAPGAPAPAPPPVVHSWQYEEIVFPEPLEPFYDILLAHPPTPLPASSAQSYADPVAYNAYRAAAEKEQRDSQTPPLPPHPLYTPAGQLIDALSLEAQRSEADRIDLARANAIQQLDKDRQHLIRTERALKEVRGKLAAAGAAPVP